MLTQQTEEVEHKFYVPFESQGKTATDEDKKLVKQIISNFVNQYLGGATAYPYPNEGNTLLYGDEKGITLEIICANNKETDTRIEQLTLLIRAVLNRLRWKQGLPSEKEVMHTAKPVNVTRLFDASNKKNEEG